MFVFDENFGQRQGFLFVLLYAELYSWNSIQNIMELKLNLKQAGVLAIAAVAALSVQARGGKTLVGVCEPVYRGYDEHTNG